MDSRIEHKLMTRLQRASKEYELFAPNDRIMVCMSGGKDSYALLHLLNGLKERLPWPISLVAVNLDQGHPGFPKDVLPRYFEEHGYEYRIVERDTLSIVKEKTPEGKTFCALCSRFRRGILYRTAKELGATKIALGHHLDDVIQTAMLNLLYGGKLSAMPPKLLSDDGENVIIRPLIQCPEDWIIQLAEELEFPIIPCNLCGSQDNLKRQQVKRMINELHAENSFVKTSMFAALGNVYPSHLLDTRLYDALDVERDRPNEPELAFAEEGNQQPAE